MFIKFIDHLLLQNTNVQKIRPVSKHQHQCFLLFKTVTKQTAKVEFTPVP